MELRTKRLLLRTHTVEDAKAFWHVINDYDTAKMTASWPYPVPYDLVKERFENALDFDETRRLMPVIVYNGQVIGNMGIGIKKEDGVPELGYTIGKKWWGKGLMTEAVIALCEYAFKTMPISFIDAETYKDNPASGRVLEKAGFVRTGEGATVYCKARQCDLGGWHYRLMRER